VIVALAIGGAELLLVIVMSVYGAVTLPPGARIPLHWAGTYDNFRSKRTGLVVWPAVAAGLFVVLVVVGSLRSHGHPAADAIRFLLPVIMFVLLVAQAGAIRAAGRRSGPAA
jgi:hypothetical protein